MNKTFSYAYGTYCGSILAGRGTIGLMNMKEYATLCVNEQLD